MVNDKYLSSGKNREKILKLTIIVGIIVLVILGCLLFFTIDFKKISKLHYEENSNLDYKVYLKENEFYETPYLGKDKKYISSLIDYIDSDFSYNFRSDDNLNIDYVYYVEADLKINDTSEENIFDKKYTLLDKKKITSTTNTFGIKEKIKIDYQKYNNLAKQFVRQYAINAKAELVVSLYVDVSGNHEKFVNNINDKSVVKIVIPLLAELNSIEMDYDLVNNNDAVLEYSSTKISNKPLFIITISLMVIVILMVIIIVFSIINNRDAEMLYKLKLNKIKKEYDKYLSETVTMKEIEDLYKEKSINAIFIKNFEDFLDVRDNLRKPILYYERIQGKETIFYILSENIVYLYVMHVNSFNKKNNK